MKNGANECTKKRRFVKNECCRAAGLSLGSVGIFVFLEMWVKRGNSSILNLDCGFGFGAEFGALLLMGLFYIWAKSADILVMEEKWGGVARGGEQVFCF